MKDFIEKENKWFKVIRSAEDKNAKVKLIVPHSQGQSYAVQSVYPCLYEITYQRGR